MHLFSSGSSAKNRWYWIRHGQSTANVNYLIASDAATAVDGFGLSALGQQQVRETLSNQITLDADTRVFSSDFLRAKQTAEITAEYLNCRQPVTSDTRLRERFFGDWEATSADNYEHVWRQDITDPDHVAANVESVNSVASRMSQVINDLEERYNGQSILLVSHGDPLQILECCLTGRPVAQHRQLSPLQTAELRSFEERH